MAKRKQYCDWCGDDLGEFERWGNEALSCGQQECNRYQRESEEERRQRVVEDALEREGFNRW